jgi:hypothetical protein
MITTSANYQKIKQFNDAHPLVAAKGDGFFSNKTAAELQLIVDQTRASLKSKREITGGNAASRLAAKAVLDLAAKDNVGVATVLWGIHQAEDFDARGDGVTSLKHFNIADPAGGSQWHLYVDRGEKTIMYMSQTAAALMHIANV